MGEREERVGNSYEGRGKGGHRGAQRKRKSDSIDWRTIGPKKLPVRALMSDLTQKDFKVAIIIT